MAGTPTPNYKFPTYAETDVPDLAGAYNQAVNAIDAKIKEVADTIPSDVDVPDANSTTKGIAKLYDSASIGDSTQEDGGVTPAAMKGYVDEKVPAEQQAYTGTAPIVVDNGSHVISVNVAESVAWETLDNADSYRGTVAIFSADWTNIPNGEVFNQVQTYNEDDVQYMDKVALSLSATASLVYGVKQYVDDSTPDASTTTKGVVQLTNTLNAAETAKALTAESFDFASGKYDGHSRPLTVSDLSRLKVNTATGLVYLVNRGTE